MMVAPLAQLLIQVEQNGVELIDLVSPSSLILARSVRLALLRNR
jgi:hypothetical protein